MRILVVITLFFSFYCSESDKKTGDYSDVIKDLIDEGDTAYKDGETPNQDGGYDRDYYFADMDLYPDIGFEFVTGKDYYQSEETDIPPKGVWFSDPNFHTMIARITDRKSDGYSGSGIQNEYSRTDPENSDGRYIILRGNDGEWYLYSGENFTMLKKLEGINSGGQEPEPRWDSSNPDVFYYFFGSEIRRYRVSESSFETVHNFRNEYPLASFISTGTEGDASLDRRYWCFMLLNDAYNLLGVVSYDRIQDKILGYYSAASLPEGVGLNWTSMDMSGEFCLFGYEDTGAGYTPPVAVFEKNLTYRLNLPDGATGHMDIAVDEEGRDVMVYQNNRTDWIAMADLKSGTEINLVEIPFATNGDIGLHFSGNNFSAPGWVLVSTYGSKNPPSGNEHSWMDNQLFMVQLKENPVILRIAHTHSYTSLDYEGEKNYFAECFAAINRKGSAIYFGSNWNIYTFEYTDEYIIILPPDWTMLVH
ncbi:MAG: hypothetical protein N3B13_02715 [Deltaproteobacteria bacterium]|nr:hypothetical protein [Deltaproteobacteria bacterium]